MADDNDSYRKKQSDHAERLALERQVMRTFGATRSEARTALATARTQREEAAGQKAPTPVVQAAQAAIAVATQGFGMRALPVVMPPTPAIPGGGAGALGSTVEIMATAYIDDEPELGIFTGYGTFTPS